MALVKDTVKPFPPVTEEAFDDRPIWEIIIELSAVLSHEEWAAQPTDGAINYRHYLYGMPKRDYPAETIPEMDMQDAAA